MRAVTQTLTRVRALSMDQRRALALACALLLVARLRHGGVPAPHILRDLRDGSRGARVTTEAARIGWAISVAARYVPWRADCLIQAMAATAWLRRRGLAGDFYLGVAKDETGALSAHAWLRSGDVVVTGACGAAFAALIEPEAPASRITKGSACRS